MNVTTRQPFADRSNIQQQKIVGKRQSIIAPPTSNVINKTNVVQQQQQQQQQQQSPQPQQPKIQNKRQSTIFFQDDESFNNNTLIAKPTISVVSTPTTPTIQDSENKIQQQKSIPSFNRRDSIIPKPIVVQHSFGSSPKKQKLDNPINQSENNLKKANEQTEVIVSNSVLIQKDKEISALKRLLKSALSEKEKVKEETEVS